MSRPPLPRAVIALGIVSLLTDVSSELVHALLPLLLVGSLGASMLMLGLIEGLAEATAAIVKLYSGALSDYIGRRKPLIVVGYSLSALTKLVFPLAASAPAVLGARLFDRLGKGIRGAPRDALIADVTPKEQRGEAYGLRQSLDTVGAIIGPLAAMGLMAWLLDVRLALWFAVLPGLLAVLVLLVYVREPEQRHSVGKPLPRWSLWREFDPGLRQVLLLAALFNLARFGEGFLVILMRDAGFGESLAPLALVVLSLTYTLSAWPVGWISDRLPRRFLLLLGVVFLLCADLVLALVPGRAAAVLGIALWGLHLGCTQGILAALVSDRARPEWRGTAFGLMHLSSGIALLVASLGAGWLWQQYGAESMLLVAAGLCVLVLVALLRLRDTVADRTAT